MAESERRVCPITPDTAAQPIYHLVRSPGRDCLEIENWNQVWLDRAGAWLINWSHISRSGSEFSQLELSLQSSSQDSRALPVWLRVTFDYIWWPETGQSHGPVRQQGEKGGSLHLTIHQHQHSYKLKVPLSPQVVVEIANQAPLICKFGCHSWRISRLFSCCSSSSGWRPHGPHVCMCKVRQVGLLEIHTGLCH